MEEKSDIEFSLEHVIPQCLGGSVVPDAFKTRDVCKKCNNDFGLFVDASFEKSWFVAHQLQSNARALFDPLHPQPVPLICMGPCNLDVPGMLDTEICESWLGPFGEQIYWVRPHDERLYWYGGGNPRTSKSVASRAYFMFSVNSSKNAGLTWHSFEDAFSGRRVKKVMCTQVVGADPGEIGFGKADLLDEDRIAFFLGKCVQKPNLHINLSMNINFDLRFMAKLAIGISHCLYKKASVSDVYLNELHKALKHRPEDEIPLINGNTSFTNESDPKFSNLVGMDAAIVLLITRVGNGTVVNLNLSPRLNWTIKIAEHDDNASAINDRVLIIFQSISKCFEMSMAEYIAFKLGKTSHPELEAIADKIRLSREYFASLTTR